MTILFDQPMLSLSTHHIHHADIDDLKTMWAVFTKCKAHLENGRRLENMSWRLWYHENKSNTTSSAAYFSCMSAVASSLSSSSSSSSVPVYSSSPAAASTTSTINTDSIHNTNTCVKRFLSSMEHQEDWSRHSQQHSTTKVEALDTNNNNSATNGPTKAAAAVSATDTSITKQTSNNGMLQQSHDRQVQQITLHQQQQESAISHQLLSKSRVSIMQIDPGDDDDDESLEHVDDDNFFDKSKPVKRSSSSRPSLLTAMLRNDNRPTIPATGSSTAPNTKSARDHFLCKELSESLRRNVLWEHIQQRALCPNQLYRHHPAAGVRPRKQEQRGANIRSNLQQNEWLESFHGW